jgi:5-methyltetrahydrofolate--homocysteine methyltransferase
MGLQPGQPPEEWVLDEPEKVKELHRRFVEAGADIILTNTFGGTRPRLKSSRYADKPLEINRRGAALAREVADRAGGEVLVAGSMGPTGELLQPLGTLSPQEVSGYYAEQAAALAQGGVDLLLVETMFDLAEARAAIEGAQRAADLPLVCTFSFDMGTVTMMGTAPAAVARELSGLGLAAMGLNCGRSLDDALEVLREMAQALEGRVPLWCKPNAGLPKMESGFPEYEITPEQMAQYAIEFVKLGAGVVGGCCGSTPEHIRAISRMVKGYLASAF